jgi:hypothetical protein
LAIVTFWGFTFTTAKGHTALWNLIGINYKFLFFACLQPSAVDNTQQQLTNQRNGPVEEKLLISNSNSNSSAALLRSSFSAEAAAAAAAADGEKESTQPGVGLLEEAGTK